MALDSNTDVEQIKTVQDGNEEQVPPANASEQAKTNDRLGNFDTLDSMAYSTSGTTAEALESKPVPEGVTPLVVADTGNADTVWVGTGTHQPVPLASAKDSFGADVNDTSEIYVRTTTAGDTVYVLWERDV